MTLKHLRSSTANKRPQPSGMADGQLAMNTASGSPGLFLKDSSGNLVKVGPVHVGTTAPNVSPASGGTAGNSLGEQWLDTSGGTYVFKIWDGAAWRSEVGEFVNSAGDTMTGSLTMGSSANLIFEGSVDDGFETTLTVVNPTADRTITLPNVTGTVVTTGDSGTITSTMIADGTIVNTDVNASAAIAGTKISPDFGSQTVQTTGIFSHALGSASAPTITFTGDTNTGIYSPGADQVVISTNGTERLLVGSSGHVGIGTTSPSTLLHLSSATGSATPTPTELRIGTSSEGADWSTTSPWGRISFYNADASGGGPKNHFVIDATSFGATGAASALSFKATASATNTLTERLNIRYDGQHTFTSDSGVAPFIVNIGASEVARIDSSGRLLVNTSSAYALGKGRITQTQVHGLSSANASSGLCAWGTAALPELNLARSRGATVGTRAVVNSGDILGDLFYSGDDGTNFIAAASIQAAVDGTPGTNDMPGRIVLSTTLDGASSPTEHLRITNDGVMCYNQAAPISYASGVTLTASDLKNGIIQYTGGAATLNLPTGTITESGFSGIYTNMTFEWSLINTGSGTCTVGSGTGHSVTGGTTVAAGVSGRFASRRTAANTFVSYRLS